MIIPLLTVYVNTPEVKFILERTRYHVTIMLMTDFIAWLINEITARGWSFSEFGRQADLAQSLVSDVINRNKAPTERFVLHAAGALGTSPTKLLRMAGYRFGYDLIEEEQEELLELWVRIDAEDRPIVLRMLRGLAKPGPQTTDIQPRREGFIVPTVGAPDTRAQPPPLSTDQRFEIIDNLVCALCPAGSENRNEKLRWIADVFAIQAILYSQLKGEGNGDDTRPDFQAVLDYLSACQQNSR